MASNILINDLDVNKKDEDEPKKVGTRLVDMFYFFQCVILSLVNLYF